MKNKDGYKLSTLFLFHEFQQELLHSIVPFRSTYLIYSFVHSLYHYDQFVRIKKEEKIHLIYFLYSRGKNEITL